jgi:outer membrane protein assembly factor BamB
VNAGSMGATCPAVAPDGTIYMMISRDLVALNSDGTSRRKLASSGKETSPVVGPDGTVYLNVDRGILALNPDGTTRWLDTLSTYHLHSPALGPDGTIYACDGDTAVALNPDGSEKWRVPLAGEVFGSPAIGTDSTICYVTHTTDAACALHPDGSPVWTTVIGDPDWVSADAHGRFWVVGDDMTLVDSTGSAILQVINMPSLQGPAVVRSNGDVVVTGQSQLLAVHPDGVWVHVLGEWRPGLAVAVDAGGDVFVGSSMGYDWPYQSEYSIVCLDSGFNRKWSIQDLGSMSAAPGVGPDGTVYIGTDRGYLYALKGGPLPVDAPWPKFGHDSRNTGCAAGH